MKTFIPTAVSPFRTLILPLVFTCLTTFGLSSCIYDAPGDRFYRTLWTSAEPFETGESRSITPENSPCSITLEFLCDSKVRITAPKASGSHGTYDHHDNTAYFHNLRLTYTRNGIPEIIVMEEAHRTDDILLISWHYSDSETSYSSRLVRKASY